MKISRSKKICLLASIWILLNTLALFAVGYRVPPPEAHYEAEHWYKEKLYIDRAFGKFTYGVWNLGFGWLELLKQPFQATGLGSNVLVGIGKGAFYAVLDTAAGAANVLTFPITALKIPIPGGGLEEKEF